MLFPIFKPRPIYPLLLIVAVTLLTVGLVQASRSQEKGRAHFRWEYKVVEYGPSICASEELQRMLNKSGDEGWEMTGFTPLSEGETQIVLQTTSVGYGRAVMPNRAGSWQGVVSPTTELGCRLVFRRPSY